MNHSIVAVITLCCLVGGCTTASQHQADVRGADEERLTLAAVQRHVQIGMSGSEVLEALGSPNIVSTDEDRHEVWVYDRVGTEFTYSESGVGMIGLVGGSSGGVAGGVLPSYGQSAGANRRSQRTLTIIIHFDGDERVKDFSYHASQF